MSTVPWRLPQPPGLAENATSIQQAPPTSEDAESPTFTFQRRYHKLNWREVLGVDLGNIIQQTDLQTLHQQLEPITFADIGPDDVSYFNDENFLHLFRLCQLLLEYQLFAWKATTVHGNLRAAKYGQLKSHTLKLREALAKCASENKSLRKELQYAKKVVQVLEEKDRAATLNAASMSRYSHHAPMQCQHHSHHQPSLQPQHKQHEEEKEPSYDPYLRAQQGEQAQQARLVKETADREIAQRNAKLENVHASLHLLLQAQQDEVKRNLDQQLQAHRATSQQLDAPDSPPSNLDIFIPTPSSSQAAQQQLINSIMQEVTTLRRGMSQSSDHDVALASFSPAVALPQATPAVSHQDTSAFHHPSLIYNFESLPTPAATAPLPTLAVVPPPTTVPGLRSTARIAPVYTAEQQAELDGMSKWLKNVEADELGAELVKMQLEAAIVKRAEDEKRHAELVAAEEAEVRRIEAAIPPDHPLLEDTILAAPAPSPHEPRPSPHGKTLEVLLPTSLPLVDSVPMLVGHTLMVSAPFTKTLPSTRDPILPLAPLADPNPLPTHEEKLDRLLALSPTSRIRALDAEKAAIKLRSVIAARSSVDQALYSPFSTMPFLSSLYNHTAESLRESYDLTFLWADTAMRTEEGAQELLRWAVQMDCTGEIYEETRSRMADLAQFYEAPPEYLAEVARVEEMERLHRIHTTQEVERSLREARWHDERITAFEAEWVALQEHEEDKEYYEALSEKNKHEAKELEFQAYLARLEEASRQAKLAAEEPEPQPLYFPPTSTSTRFVNAPTLASPRADRERPFPTPASPVSLARPPPFAPIAANSPSRAAPSSSLKSKMHPPLPSKRGKPLSRAARLAIDDGDDDDEEEEDESENEFFQAPALDQKANNPPVAAAAAAVAAPATPTTPERRKLGSVQFRSPHSPLNTAAAAPANPPTAKSPATTVAAPASSAKRPVVDDDSDDAEDDAEDDDAAARKAISRLASGTFEPTAAAQFSRPGAAKKPQSLVVPKPTTQQQPPNQTPEKAPSPTHALVDERPIRGVPVSTSASSFASGPSYGGANARPKTSVGSARPRFLSNDSFEDDDDTDEPQSVPPQDDPPPRTPALGQFTSDGSRTLNPRRSAAVNLSEVSKPVTISSNLPSSRPIGMLVGQADAFHGESDSSVSDVSSVVHLDDDASRHQARDSTVVGSADLNFAPSPAASPAPGPLLLAGGSGPSIIQTGRGRPRGQASTLGQSSAALERANFREPETDSLSSLLGGGMKRPPGRGLSSGPGGFKSRLIKMDSDNDSSLDLND